MTDTITFDWVRNFKLSAFILIAFSIFWIYFSRNLSSNIIDVVSAPREGFLAPDFTLNTLDGSQITLSTLRGKIVVINFWATWCPPCRAETPALQNSFEQYKDVDIVILGIDLANQDSIDNVKNFVRDFTLTYPILLDIEGKVANLYQNNALPSTYFVDREGIIRTIIIGGPMSETVIKSKIEALLKEEQ
ncbi:MAG: TlpA family protein disulfide reductase [Anaerolineales bacterium]|nr:TlpA family protein disulfide reductase [Anaerolineales bacterium]